MNHGFGQQGPADCLYLACPNEQSTCMCTHCYRGGTSFVRLISEMRLRTLQTCAVRTGKDILQSMFSKPGASQFLDLNRTSFMFLNMKATHN